MKIPVPHLIKVKQILFYTIFLFFLIYHKSLAQVQGSTFEMNFGKGIKFTSADSLFTLAISGRIQSLFAVNRNITNETAGADFILRRSRLNFQGTALNPNFTYRIQIGFAQGDITSANSQVENNLVLRDAMLFYSAKKWLQLGFGQTKLPGNRQRQISSGNLQLVERSIANNNFTLDRDKGIWVYTNFNINKSVLRSTIAISSGEGRIISARNGRLSYAGRVEYLPFGAFTNRGDYIGGDMERESTPKVSIAAVYNFNNAATRTMGQLGEFLFNSETANIQYFGGDFMLKYKGFSLESELYSRNSDKGIIMNSEDSTQQNFVISGTTFMLQSGYFLTKKNEIAARYAQITPDTKVASIMNSQKEYVIGFSHYFNQHNLKLQSDVTYLENGINKGFIYRFSGVVRF